MTDRRYLRIARDVAQDDKSDKAIEKVSELLANQAKIGRWNIRRIHTKRRGLEPPERDPVVGGTVRRKPQFESSVFHVKP